MERSASGLHEALLAAFRMRRRVLVAFSGGVDSAVLARIAHEALGEDALAVIVDSESYAPEEREAAVGFARALGIPHEVVFHSELADPDYVANPVERCYFCRKGMGETLAELAKARGFDAIVAGTNADDLNVYRPGTRALDEARVWQPYVELGVGKDEVRRLARHLELPLWDKPSMACLSSRIPYGEPVTLGKLSRIAQAEGLLRLRGFRQVRVRTLDDGRLARVEVLPEEVPRLLEMLPSLAGAFTVLGYEVLEADPRGYRTGAMNEAAGLS